MNKYNYKEHMVEDIVDYIKVNDILNSYECETFQDWMDLLNDELWDCDEITGNGSSYYDTEEKCSEYLCHNFDLAYEAAREFYYDDHINILIKQYENHSLARYFDSVIRCYLLYECIGEALTKLGINNEE